MKCIEEEIPFELPEGWEWCRLINICSKLIDGDHNPPKGEDTVTQYLMLSSTNINNDTLVELEKVRYLSKDIFDKENQRTDVNIGDIFFTSVGSIGRSCVYTGGFNICFQRSVSVIRTFILNEYLKRYLDAPFIQNKIAREATGTAQKGFYLNQLSNCLIAVPPINEQQKIANAVNKLMEYIVSIETDKTTLQDLIKQTKFKILDLAIRGKLVPQDPNDEPASVLLERIRTEKEELIKQGKIKRDKKESVIFKGDDNSYYLLTSDNKSYKVHMPYELPRGWELTSISSACIINPKNSIDDNTEVSFVPMPLINEGFSNNHTYEIKKWSDVKSGFTHFAENDIGIAKITPCFENRKSVIFNNLKNGYGAGTTELHIIRTISNAIIPEYILCIAKSKDFISKGVNNFTGAVGQQRISKDFIANYFIPIPPLAEQHRIVNAIETIFAKLDEIANALS